MRKIEFLDDNSFRIQFDPHELYLEEKISFFPDQNQNFLIDNLFSCHIGINEIIIENNSIIFKLEDSYGSDSFQNEILYNEILTVLENYLKSGAKINDAINKDKTAFIEEYKGEDHVISVEPTPNPSAFKFLLDQNYFDSSKYFASIEEASNSYLVRKIFSVPTVRAVFLDKNFITVSFDDFGKDDISLVFRIINQYLLKETLLEESSEIKPTKDFSETEKKIIDILDNMVKPSVRNDGGDVTYVRFENGKLVLKFLGACVGCPSSEITLKQGIENLFKHYMPEVEEVVSDES